MAKCPYCKAEITKESAVLMPIGKTNRYFCSEAEWFLYQENREYKDKAYRIILSLLQTKKASTSLWDEWVKWNKICSNKKLFLFLSEKKEYLQQAMDKDFVSDYAKVRYLSAIIKNDISRFEPKLKEPTTIKKETTFELYKPRTPARKRRVGFDVLEREQHVG